MPGDLNSITVHGTYVDYSGAPITGSVQFKPSITLMDPGSDLLLVPKTFTAVLDGTGHFSISLPATDDPDVTPNGWTYTVTESFVGGRTFNITVPLNSPGGSVSLTSLAPTAVSSGLANFVLLPDFNALKTEVDGIQAGSSGVASFNTRTGAVSLTKADVTAVGLTASDVGADTAGAATTEQTRALAAEALLAPKASPVFTGTPAAPTPTTTDNTTKLATTAFVQAVVNALINGAPGTLDTINELATALGDDPNFATTITNALAGKLAIAQNLADLNNPTTARTNLGLGGSATLNVGSTAGTVAAGNDTRLRPYTSGLIGARPTPAAYGAGWYFATDDNGGTLYNSDGSTWTKVTLGLSWASGTQLAYAEDTALAFNALTNGTTWTDLSTPLRITVPASSVPVRLSGKVFGNNKTGTSVQGAIDTVQLALTDNSGTLLDVDALTAVQVTVVNQTWVKGFYVEYTLPAPVTSATYKLMGRFSAAAPANWSGANFVSGGINPPKAFIKAVAE